MPASLPDSRSRQPLRRRWARVVVVATLLLATGCVRQIVRDSVGAATSPEAQDQVAQLVGNPQLVDAIHELGKNIVLGALDGLSDRDLNTKLQRSIADFVDQLVPVLADAVQMDLGPAVQDQIHRAVDTAVHTAFTGENKGILERAVAGIVQAAMTTLAKNLGTTNLYEIGPALQRMLEENIGPGVRTVIEDDVGPGVQTMLDDNVLPSVGDELDRQRRSFADELANAMQKGQRTVTSVMWAFFTMNLVFLVVMFVLVRHLLRERAESAKVRVEGERAKQESERGRAAARHLVRQISDHRDRSVEELLAALRRTKYVDEGRYIDGVIEENPEYTVPERSKSTG